MSESEFEKASFSTIKLKNHESCPYYKPLLIEELFFQPNPLLLHYGKCVVIGRLTGDSTGRYYLANIFMEFMKSDAIESGAIELPLFLPCNVLDELADLNKPNIGILNDSVEVFGEVVIYDSRIKGWECSKHLINSRVLLKYLRYLQNVAIKKEKYNEHSFAGGIETSDFMDQCIITTLYSSEMEAIPKHCVYLNLQKLSMYKPAIFVHYVRRCPSPVQRMEANLSLRLFS